MVVILQEQGGEVIIVTDYQPETKASELVEVNRYGLLNSVLEDYQLRCWKIEHRFKVKIYIISDNVHNPYRKDYEDTVDEPYLTLAQRIIDDYVKSEDI